LLLHEAISGDAGVAPAVVAALSALGSFLFGQRGLWRHAVGRCSLNVKFNVAADDFARFR